ncbi:MAG: hypothetical protein M0P12_01600 [Paludibacteraceae bacterium]|nr:hypothetical protein [Paludibacteraceae bacterium]MCK9615908.1 hypothetical protein [Candidatus Omnitrophota bacterium]
MKTLLFTIDPQNDFVFENGMLPVPNAKQDMARIINFLNTRGQEIDDILISLDAHSCIHVGHPNFWEMKDGSEVNPFTLVDAEMLKKIKPRFCEAYVKADIKKNGPVMIWPEHCIKGDFGFCVYTPLMTAIDEWQIKHGKPVTFVEKGMDIRFEMHSAFSRGKNLDVLKFISTYDRVLVCGEALTHCVKQTVDDMVKFFGVLDKTQIIVFNDCTSPIIGFDISDWIKEMKDKGVVFTESYNFKG